MEVVEVVQGEKPVELVQLQARQWGQAALEVKVLKVLQGKPGLACRLPKVVEVVIVLKVVFLRRVRSDPYLPGSLGEGSGGSKASEGDSWAGAGKRGGGGGRGYDGCVGRG